VDYLIRLVKGESSRYAVLAPVVQLHTAFDAAKFPQHQSLCSRLKLVPLVLNHDPKNDFELASNAKCTEGTLNYKAIALDQVTRGRHTVMLVLVPDAEGAQHTLLKQFPDVCICGVVGWVPLSCVNPVSAPTLSYTKQRDVYTNTLVPSVAAFQFRSVEVLMPAGKVIW
jgi:hypothetical protein